MPELEEWEQKDQMPELEEWLPQDLPGGSRAGA
jgi:hypothetical protein